MSTRKKHNRSRSRRNKTMKGGFFPGAGEFANMAAQHVSGNPPGLSVIGKGLLTPQTASIADNVMKQNPGAADAVSGSLKAMAPNVKNIVTQLIPLLRELFTAVINQIPQPMNFVAMKTMNTVLSILPRIITMALEHPQQAMLYIGKLVSSAESMGIRIV